ncbi:MAG: hypothetical protein ABSE73_01465 [Planctomycetota bacterium]
MTTSQERELQDSNPVYHIYRAVGRRQLKRKCEPWWLEIVVDPESRRCWPVAQQHYRPLQSQTGHLFYIPGTPHNMTNFGGETWIEVKGKCFLPAGTTLRRYGILEGEIARQFRAFLDSRRRVERPSGITSASLERLLDNEEILIAPWAYLKTGCNAVTSAERLALKAYQDAYRSETVPSNCCYYRGFENKIRLPPDGTPCVWLWMLAYAQWLWVNALEPKIREEWLRLIATPDRREPRFRAPPARVGFEVTRSESARYLLFRHSTLAPFHIDNEEMTPDLEGRITFGEACSCAFEVAGEVQSWELQSFIERVCWGFLFRKRV